MIQGRIVLTKLCHLLIWSMGFILLPNFALAGANYKIDITFRSVIEFLPEEVAGLAGGSNWKAVDPALWDFSMIEVSQHDGATRWFGTAAYTASTKRQPVLVFDINQNSKEDNQDIKLMPAAIPEGHVNSWAPGTVFFIQGSCQCAGQSNLCTVGRYYDISIVDRNSGQNLWGPENHLAIMENTCSFTVVLGKERSLDSSIFDRPWNSLGVKLEYANYSQVVGVWISKGTAGPQGEQGPPGQQGEPGLPGEQGEQGEQGLPGEKGATGLPGPAGAQGPQGEVGPQGAAGANGSAGDAGPAGEPGAEGPRGPRGLDGPTGAPGPKGEEGPAGPRGPAGEQGLPGNEGPQGLPGPAGEQGLAGPRGPTGESGADGPQGPKGEQGLTGAQGIEGEKGDTGPQGERGPIGPRGLQGPEGERGAEGPQGPEGAQGPQGPQGPRGPRGGGHLDELEGLPQACKNDLDGLCTQGQWLRVGGKLFQPVPLLEGKPVGTKYIKLSAKPNQDGWYVISKLSATKVLGARFWSLSGSEVKAVIEQVGAQLLVRPVGRAIEEQAILEMRYLE